MSTDTVLEFLLGKLTRVLVSVMHFDEEDAKSPSLAVLTAEYELWCKIAPTLN